ncbi:Essential recombination function protein, partial [uncultured Caudovirales phage]
SGGKTPMHALGSSVSYGKRYGLLTVTGIATEDDDDGKAAGVVGFITEDQQASLRKLLDDTITDVAQFLQFANADNMGEIPARDYARLHGLLTKKKAQKGAK